MSQATLFDALARATDPVTSHAAAADDHTSLERSVLEAVRAAGWHGATADEAWHAVGRSRPNSVARRLTTLVRSGLVECCGTRPGDSGKQQKVYRVRPVLMEEG